MDKTVDIIGVASDKGASMRGCDLGARAIRHTGLIGKIKSLGYAVNDCGDITVGDKSGDENKTKSPLKNLSLVNEVNCLTYQKVRETLKNGGFPVVLGGDHSITAASATAVQRHYGKIGIIWVDAHGDFNDAFSSPSGNIHGTPLSAITGQGPDEILPFKDKQAEFISPKNTVIIGARDLDDAEKIRLKKAGVTVFTAQDIEKSGVSDIVRKAVEIASNGTKGIYLSFDLDAIDPLYAPGVGTPVDGGLTYREALLLCGLMSQSGTLLGVEVTETNPIMDERNRTAIIAAELITHMLGKTSL